MASEEDAQNAWQFLCQAKGVSGVSAEYEAEDGRVYFSAQSSRLSYELRRKGVAGSTLVDTAILLAKLLPYAAKEAHQAQAPLPLAYQVGRGPLDEDPDGL